MGRIKTESRRLERTGRLATRLMMIGTDRLGSAVPGVFGHFRDGELRREIVGEARYNLSGRQPTASPARTRLLLVISTPRWGKW